MPNVTYVSIDGSKMVIDVPVGESVMAAAIANGIPGIVATCGGNCMCGTCHVYVEEDHGPEVPAMTPDEDGMLDFAAADRKPNSRLSCQLTVTEGTDGLVVQVPPNQV